MDAYRREYANRAYTEIKQTEISIKRDREAQKNVRNMGLSSDELRKKQDHLEMSIKQKEERLKKLNEERDAYLAGRLDSEIESEMKKNIVKPVLRKKKPVTYVKPVFIKRERRTEPLEKDIRYYRRQFDKADEYLPDYMRHNLDNMPNNKGYIWRGCMFFGKLEPEYDKPRILFEKLKGGDMKIHEFDKTHYTITEKKRRYYN
jgi:hypothetical protein